MSLKINTGTQFKELSTVTINTGTQLKELNSLKINVGTASTPDLKELLNVTENVTATWSRVAGSTGTGGCTQIDDYTFKLFSKEGKSPPSTTDLVTSNFKQGTTIYFIAVGGSEGHQGGGGTWGSNCWIYDTSDTQVYSNSNYLSSSGSYYYNFLQDGYVRLQTSGGGTYAVPESSVTVHAVDKNGEDIEITIIQG